MTYRNGLKEYGLMALIYGGLMGIWFSIIYGVLVGVISAVFCGALFSFLMYLFVRFQEKKFAKMREEIAGERAIVCDGGATIAGNGGWLFLTERGLEFYAHKFNLSTKNKLIPLETIKSVRAKYNRIFVVTADGSEHNIVVSHSDGWKSHIDAFIT